MKNKSLYWLKWLLVVTFIVPLLTACGQMDISETYPLESVTKEGNSSSYVYRAAGVEVPAVATALADKRKPEQISKEDKERMFLVYPDEVIQLQRDTENPEDTLIEVDSKEYVQKNYDRSFLEMYIQYKIVDTLFDSLSGFGKYRGYTQQRQYAPSKPYRAPTQEDKKKAPPITVERKGSIFRRGSNQDSTVGSGGSIFNRTPSSKGSITRDKSGGSKYSSKSPTIKKSKPPRTRIGKGGITRRGRR
ncbi:DUF4247 domain-containing protein [Paenibacillus sp. ACRRX]|uniref:DUF4247 domain-containing protein n=1 Tax=Paenibacillus sp. ACRRX TaxID=2918206 RepID=UPI001EF55486|nr:DUF4247 domain-containing protein [Paenibacillus sp. ACRRX]MCG7409337.1 DUF4247 domain-containing protein [Paenibacillus sp. ACRRX]